MKTIKKKPRKKPRKALPRKALKPWGQFSPSELREVREDTFAVDVKHGEPYWGFC